MDLALRIHLLFNDFPYITWMTGEKQPSFRNYAAFWPFYLSQHADPRTRSAHVFGTFLGLLFFIAAIVTFSLKWLFIALLAGYGFAWWSHAYIERNRPATFEYPLWSLRADLHMFALWITGRLRRELIRYKIRN